MIKYFIRHMKEHLKSPTVLEDINQRGPEKIIEGIQTLQKQLPFVPPLDNEADYPDTVVTGDDGYNASQDSLE